MANRVGSTPFIFTGSPQQRKDEKKPDRIAAAEEAIWKTPPPQGASPMELELYSLNCKI